MLWFNKNKLSSSGLLRGMTDAHSHILPGVDDGVPSIEDSLEILRIYEEQGVSTVWLTPHIMEDIPNTTEELQQRYEELKTAYNGPIELRLAAEYMLDNLFEERLDADDLLYHSIPDAPQKELLVETSYFNPPMDLYGTLSKIKSKGIYPILAHPERYFYMDDKDYEKLKAMGVRFQLNLFSLTGQYGKKAQENAEKLLKGGYYSLMGTDLHRHKALVRQLDEKIKKSFIPTLSLIR